MFDSISRVLNGRTVTLLDILYDNHYDILEYNPRYDYCLVNPFNLLFNSVVLMKNGKTVTW